MITIMDIIGTISQNCNCSRMQASENLHAEIDHLRELMSLNDFHYEDLETACENLGLEHDYIPFFTGLLIA